MQKPNLNGMENIESVQFKLIKIKNVESKFTRRMLQVRTKMNQNSNVLDASQIIQPFTYELQN